MKLYKRRSRERKEELGQVTNEPKGQQGMWVCVSVYVRRGGHVTLKEREKQNEGERMTE